MALGSSGRLGDESEQGFARVDRHVAEAQLKTSARTAALALTWPPSPPWLRQTVAPLVA
jgi:hypothetical protein